MKAYFYGELVVGEELEKTAKQRQKKYHEVTTPESNKDSYLSKGWKLKKKYKRSVKLFKEKGIDELLEDEVWLLFKNMGFTEMNKDRNFKIQAGPVQKKQIDVFAKDGNNVFVIECKAQSEKGPRLLGKDMHEILNLRGDITKSLRKHYEQKVRVSFLLVTKNIVWSSTDERIASDNREKSLFFWKETDLESYTNLTNQLGESARFQMYSILFFGKKIDELGDIEVPAIYGGKRKNKYYSFIIQPEKLLQVAYVHRREESNSEEVSGTYQRMLKKSKLDRICKFINGKHFFPNNIILNFTEEPIFERKDEVGDIVYGILKFPRSYGSAWVIDGQHRLFGYSETGRKATDTLPVVAFVKLKTVRQAQLFVDINREQTPVSSNLLWDLYPDIYYGIEEDKYQTLRAISLIVKKLNFESDSPLHKHIYIPSVPREPKGVTNLTMASVCEGLKENRLINREEQLLYRGNYEDTVDFASKIIKAYFEVIAKSFPEDWEKGNKGLLRTNIGIRIFLVILRQLIKYLKYEGLERVYTKQNLKDFKSKVEEIVGRVIVKLKEMPVAERDNIRKESSKGWVLQNAQMLIWYLKEEFNFGLELWRKGGWAPSIPDEESEESIKELIKDTEIQSKKYIVEELAKIHGETWWVEGIPEGVKRTIKDKIDQDIKRFTFKREKINSYTNEKKFIMYSSTSDLKEIVKKKNNWEKLAEVFGDSEYTSSQFKSLEVIRNVYIGHEERKEEIDEIEKNLGYWGTKWIRRCIGLDKTINKSKKLE